MNTLQFVPVDARLFPAGKIAAVVVTLGRDGVPAERLLRGSDLTPAALDHPDTLTSVRQFLRVCDNALQVCADAALGLRLGAAMRTSMHGPLGYALLCAPTLRDAYELGQRCLPLFGPTMHSRLHIDARAVVWEFPGTPTCGESDLSPKLVAMLLQLQIANMVRQHQDLMGADCVPQRVSLAVTPPPALAARYRSCLLGPVAFGQPGNELVYAASWLDRPAPFANRATAAALRHSCTAQLGDLQRAAGAAREVHRALAAQPGRFPSLEAIAAQMNLAPRTLRRRLSAEGTSYQQLLDGVRRELAIGYLQGTARTLDDITEALGYSDSASFRHAFRRWTGKAPTEFRRRV